MTHFWDCETIFFGEMGFPGKFLAYTLLPTALAESLIRLVIEYYARRDDTVGTYCHVKRELGNVIS